MTAPRPADADAAVRAWLTTPTAQLAADVVVVGRELGPWGRPRLRRGFVMPASTT